MSTVDSRLGKLLAIPPSHPTQPSPEGVSQAHPMRTYLTPLQNGRTRRDDATKAMLSR